MPNGQVPAFTTIGEFERLPQDFDFFIKSIGLKGIQLTQQNKYEYSFSFSEIFDQEGVDLVAEIEKPIIKMFAYEPPTT